MDVFSSSTSAEVQNRAVGFTVVITQQTGILENSLRYIIYNTFTYHSLHIQLEFCSFSFPVFVISNMKNGSA